ncbi:MAG: hypothetical protein NTY62_08405 [Euryarchaeota archaeon]|nr:hypothetical protein [Euryarchaeota archaeon]
MAAAVAIVVLFGIGVLAKGMVFPWLVFTIRRGKFGEGKSGGGRLRD